MAPSNLPPLPGLEVLLDRAAAPERARVRLERLIQEAADPASLACELGRDPRLLENVITLLSGSQFLGELLVRRPEYLPRLREIKRLARPKETTHFVAEARQTCAGWAKAEDQLDALRRFQRWELLRLGACDLLGLLDLPTITAQLSRLAESMVRVCLALGAEHLGCEANVLTVLALGKLGGEELNYSSDIDLVFLAAEPERARRLAEWLIGALSRPTAEGFLYRVDLRLRPWGEVGPLVASVEGYRAYLQRHARLWEKQALLKARVIAGDEDLGRAFLRGAAPLLCASEEEARAAVHQMKRRIEEQLTQRGQAWGEVKLGIGSIRDVEFVAQYLQLVHGAGAAEVDVLSPNTLDALARLHSGGILPADDYRVLVEGYTFLRAVEHYLQMLDNRQTHLLPTDASEIAYLARRLGFSGPEAGERFLARYQEHSAAIRAVYRRYLAPEEASMIPTQPPNYAVERHLARMVPSYAETFTPEEIGQHAALAAGLSPERPVEVRAEALADGSWRVTIVGYDYPGELSLICGLLFAYGLSIREGHVFTYEPLKEGPARSLAARRKIVDVFTVQPVLAPISAESWASYAEELAGLLRLLEQGAHDAAHGALARRVAEALKAWGVPRTTLQPVEITIDNAASERYTVLIIDAPDTIGFLYEFTSALALSGLYIAQVTVDSVGQRVHDVLYLCDAQGRKIIAPEKQRELRAATVLIKHFTHLLPQSPNPESALLHFREFLGQLFLRPDWPDALTSLSRPEVLTALARLLGVSDFLWDDFLRMQYANLFPVVSAVDELAQAKDKAMLRAELCAALKADEDWRTALNAFKDREMFRVDLRHILGYCADFGQFSAELTDLAEIVVEAACEGCLRELHRQFGAPLLEDGRECPWCACALGKCGGRELGYASDIELLFLYAASGETGGPQRISVAEFYEKMVQGVLGAIRARREGIFHLDLRLRPYGEAGSLAVSLQSFRRYFAPDGPRWEYERMALVKLRPIAGDAALGQEILALRDALVYNGDPPDLAALRAMRERQLRHLVAGGTLNAKFSLGGLVDVEYLVQALQIRHGHLRPSLRVANTREALAALREEGILSAEEYRRLDAAYVFLRQLIDALRMVRGNAQDLTVPPPESDEFSFLARRLGYGSETARLREDLLGHLQAVRELNARLLGQG